MPLHINCKADYSGSRNVSENGNSSIEDKATFPTLIKSENECRSILSSHINIKDEDDDDDEDFAHLTPLGECSKFYKIGKILSCAACTFKTFSTDEFDEHIKRHARKSFRKIMCKECALVGFRFCTIHRKEYFQNHLTLNPCVMSKNNSKSPPKTKHSETLILNQKCARPVSESLTLQASLTPNNSKPTPETSILNQARPVSESITHQTDQKPTANATPKSNSHSNLESETIVEPLVSSDPPPLLCLECIRVGYKYCKFHHVVYYQNRLSTKDRKLLTKLPPKINESPVLQSDELNSNSDKINLRTRVKNVSRVSSKVVDAVSTRSKSNPKKPRKKNVSKVSLKANRRRNSSTSSESILQIDLQIVEKPKKFKISKPAFTKLQCKHCSIMFKSVFKLLKHVPVHSKLNTCSNCQYQTTDICDFEQHLRSHAIEKPFACTLCVFETPWKREFEEHMKMHTNPPAPKYKCRTCDFTASVEELYVYHKDFDYCVLLECDLCPYKDFKRKYFEMHMEGHLVRCNSCSYETTNKSFLANHMTCHRLNQPFVFQCNLCPYETTKELIFEMHLNDHNEPLVSQCQLCVYKTEDILLFDDHMNAHADEQISTDQMPLKNHSFNDYVSCEFCDVRFNNHRLLQAHQKRCSIRYDEAGQRPQYKFKCTQCQYKTSVKQLLQMHRNAAHLMKQVSTSERPFVCRKCGFSTQLKYTYNRHKVLHFRKLYALRLYRNKIMNASLKHSRLRTFTHDL